jgi:hypothetical protein
MLLILFFSDVVVVRFGCSSSAKGEVKIVKVLFSLLYVFITSLQRQSKAKRGFELKKKLSQLNKFLRRSKKKYTTKCLIVNERES